MNKALAISFFALLGFVPAASAAGPYDGTWNTVVSCENGHGALGYSYEFPSVVRDSVLHGEKGTKNEAGWFQIDGTIGADGTANFYADGLVGASAFAVGNRPAGTQYGYHVDAKFSGGSGSGHRVEGRPCTVEFTKQ